MSNEGGNGIGTEELCKWSYGIGIEGIRKTERNADIGMIIGEEYPIWFNAAKAVGLNVLSIWLLSDKTFPLPYITSFIKDVPIRCGSSICDLTLTHLKECKWVLIGGRVTDHIVSSGLFEMINVQHVLYTTALNRLPPRGWNLSELRINHSDVGGVTDGKHRIFMLSRVWSLQGLVTQPTPSQDLRSILKSGEMGQLDSSMMLPVATESADGVKYFGRNRIVESSLLPSLNMAIRVRTQWRGHLWVLRELNTFEKLLAFDVPEKLIRMVPEGADRGRLLSLNRIPNKVLYACLSGLMISHKVTQSKGKRELDKSVDVGRVGKRQKLELVVDEERNPKVRLKRKRTVHPLDTIPELDEDNEIDQVTPCDAINHNLKATKNDSAEVRTELWNGYLLQGLHVDIQKRNILDAVDKLRDWLLRIWKRRLTLSFTKWAKTRYVREHYERDVVYDDARDCISRAANASWWAWDMGSRPFFWRWPVDYIETVRNGSTVWIDGQVKPWKNKQRGTTDAVRKGLKKGEIGHHSSETLRRERHNYFADVVL